jgi:uncharacterized protein YeaO (DUF488 family)
VKRPAQVKKAGAPGPAQVDGIEIAPPRFTRGDVDRVKTKRVYESSVSADGTRVLIMRYWPRGIRKEKVDVWLRELAPVIPLLRAYLDGEITWAQYRPRYRAGLRRPEAQAALGELRTLARRGPVTLLCGCADPSVCHRTLLHKHLLDSAE